ncbi:EAL domain-containing protein [Pseudomonas sp. Au-Pse12]|uniref:EAL domain-containing protein n=1 Tax=Pseudomonas sp. Au-Pse12 TaxID=2906459 RepID=UPI001E4807EB|nr:EAL domain-containing protein [Pseudomonas sp. Au-Pse12]MCE4052589.1 EAL domain-containing protein [Pseudomonas sp. Au-Pse12]
MRQLGFKLFFTHRLALLAGAESLRSIREGLLWLLPCLLVSAMLLILGQCAQALGAPPELVQLLTGLHARISSIIPLLVAASIGYMLAIKYRLPQLPVAFLCLSHVVIAIYLLRDYPLAAATFVLFIAIASPLVNVPLMARLHRLRWTRLVDEGLVGHNLKGTINMVLPGMLTSLVLVGVLQLLLHVHDFASIAQPIAIDRLDNPYVNAILLTSTNSLLWFFGIHGTYAMQPLMDLMDQAVTLNAADLAAGRPLRYALNSGLLGCFAFIGGSGGSLALVLAILGFSRNRSMRLLALASLALSLFNVNELLLFGLPIILNPRLLVPFMLVPMVNVSLALATVQLGWVSPAVVSLPFTSPVLLNAYLSTQGDWGAVFLQVLLLGVGTLIYLPYVRSIQRQSEQHAQVYLKTFDATFHGLEERGRLFELDPMVASYQQAARNALQLARIQQLSDYEFHLEYQPQIAKGSGLCSGCEALIRARDREGKVRAPWELLQWLGQAKLMPEVDFWVASQAVRQHLAWRKVGFELPITINISSATLASREHGQRLLEILARAEGKVSVEITEDALVGDALLTQQWIGQLHALGAQVYIDDFGTGFSALSYLHQFPVDGIKIDRSFVLAQREPKGAQVLNGLLRFCETLKLKVVVEGVETREQLDFLQSSSELIIQGWYYSKSLPGEQIPGFVSQRAREARVVSRD